jgi:segregation and condensation protein A
MEEFGGTDAALRDSDLLHVKLPAFDGPLDLLLHLVRQHQLDIQQLRLADLTEPYLKALEDMPEPNLDSAGEFLALASTLVWIKSKSLLPRDFTDEEPDSSEMETLLIQRLQDYQRIKDAAARLTGLDLLGRDLFPRQVPLEDDGGEAEEPRYDIDPISIFDLIEAFRGVLERAREPEALNTVPPRESIEERVGRLLVQFESRRVLAFLDLFDVNAGKTEVVLVFLALLEMVRLKAVRISQSVPKGEILCSTTENFAGGGQDWKDAVMLALIGPGGAVLSRTPNPS